MKNLEEAIFAGGCFWCTEAIFKRLKGVVSVVSGYSGDGASAPTYEEVSTGNTDFFESIKIVFDPKIINFETLLLVFFKTHDPTSIDRQGADHGKQYRSIVFYLSEEQRKKTLKIINALEARRVFPGKIVTELKAHKKFFVAENYHQDFYSKNLNYPYCRVVISPKLNKLVNEFNYLLQPPF